MRLRDHYSTSVAFGYRIDGISLASQRAEAGSPRNAPAVLRSLRTESQLDAALSTFFEIGGRGPALREVFARKLLAFRDVLEASDWFARHECVGSSLLFVFDGAATSEEAASASADLRWIDFTKVVTVEERLTHRAAWEPGQGSHEDGFLTGVDSLLSKLQ
jgi:1D-myo-inositol-triphosphate 3-kinase